MDNTEKTIIVGGIVFLNRSLIIHSVHTVYRVGSKEEQEAIVDMLDSQTDDWVIVQDYKGEITVTKNCLLSLVGCIKGE